MLQFKYNFNKNTFLLGVEIILHFAVKRACGFIFRYFSALSRYYVRRWQGQTIQMPYWHRRTLVTYIYIDSISADMELCGSSAFPGNNPTEAMKVMWNRFTTWKEFVKLFVIRT